MPLSVRSDVACSFVLSFRTHSLVVVALCSQVDYALIVLERAFETTHYSDVARGTVSLQRYAPRQLQEAQTNDDNKIH